MITLKEKGIQMVAFFGVFAKESVRVRCNEIKHMLKDFEAKLEARKQLLQVSLDVFTCLDQVSELKRNFLGVIENYKELRFL